MEMEREREAVDVPTTPPDYCNDQHHQTYLTGYLEDALVQFSVSRYNKRRRRLVLPPNPNLQYCAQISTTTTSYAPPHHHQPADALITPPVRFDDYSTALFSPAELSTDYYCGGSNVRYNLDEEILAARKRQRQRQIINDNLEYFSSDTKCTDEKAAGSAPTSSGIGAAESVEYYYSSKSKSKSISTSTSPSCKSSSNSSKNNQYNCFSSDTSSSPSALRNSPPPYAPGQDYYYCDLDDEGDNKQNFSPHHYHPKKRPAAAASASISHLATLTTKRVVAYPFAMVKPGGMYGDITLSEINRKLLMPPTRPVRHPVGIYACKPTVISADGRGLSGKAVVALTRIHTQGSGTITIIRTKG